MDPVEITAGRWHLRPWQPGDEAVLVEVGNDPDVQRWNALPVPYLPEHARTYVHRTSVEGWASGRALTWAVCDSTTGQVLAHLALRRAADPDVWDVGNTPSRRAAEKAGFRIEGVLRRGLVHRGLHVDGWLGALLPDDPVRDTALLPPLGRPTDGVVALRHVRESDLALVQRACEDAESARWLPLPVPYSAEAARTWALHVVPAEWAAGTAASVAVADAATDELLGAVGLTVGRDRTGEVGYWTAPQARGRGVAVRAARLHTAWGVTAAGLARVELLTDVRNTASQRVAEKAGFVREGVARSVRSAPRSDERVDMVVWAYVPDRLR